MKAIFIYKLNKLTNPTIIAHIYPFVLERGGVQRCVRKRLVQSVATLQILRQDDDHEGPAAGENHRRQVRNFILAPLCFGECKID